jgi:hypothetical protein
MNEKPMTVGEFQLRESQFCEELIYKAHCLEREAEKLVVDYQEIIDTLERLLKLSFDMRDLKKEN